VCQLSGLLAAIKNLGQDKIYHPKRIKMWNEEEELMKSEDNNGDVDYSDDVTEKAYEEMKTLQNKHWKTIMQKGCWNANIQTPFWRVRNIKKKKTKTKKWEENS